MYRLILVIFVSFAFALNVHSTENPSFDIDNDLVPNTLDKCPNTPEAVFVTRYGCTKEIKRTVYFDHASIVLDNEDKLIIGEVADILKELTGYKVFVSGHTDSIADYKTNIYISKRRALIVQNILLQQDIPKDKITTSWHGETMPVSTNVTAEGRSDNRRVDIILK